MLGSSSRGVVMDREFDEHLYGSADKFEGYSYSIPTYDNDDEEERRCHSTQTQAVEKMLSYTAPRHLMSELADVEKMLSYTAPRHLMSELADGGDDDGGKIGLRKSRRIIDRENDYRKRRFNRKLSPPRHDPFAAGDESPDATVSTYADVMRQEALKRAEHETLSLIAQKFKDKPGGKDYEEKFMARNLIAQKFKDKPGGKDYKEKVMARKRSLDVCSTPTDSENVKCTPNKNCRPRHL